MSGAQHCRYAIACVDERSDQRIRELCAKILVTKDDADLVPLCAELRAAIQGRIDKIMSNFQKSPFAAGTEERE